MDKIGTKALWAVIAGALVVIPMAVLLSPWWWLLEIVFLPLVFVGIYDLVQTRHSILRNYPIAGHLRFILEGMGPEMHQYIVENDTDGRPFDRDTRSLIYERAKGVADKKPFGTEQDVYADGLHLADALDRDAPDARQTRWPTCASRSEGRSARSRTRCRCSTSRR